MVVNSPTCVGSIYVNSFAIAGMFAAIAGLEEINNATDSKEYSLNFSMCINNIQLLWLDGDALLVNSFCFSSSFEISLPFK
ncbi:hypothetical protein SB781_36830, partial [Paraburkholderia sp. SIMBA_061]